ncbi:MAG TPA: putative molybdenum carrier protein [Pyrinomonadaceae bacterium]|nr:putative molybdenum carrier protein [Pyrinomonadaceae bacterium]HMP64265.1 putative molybdenum carrier protein [Pyrinomonadaceae bacterium]
MYLKKIITGGQTGVDRAAWDAALEFGIAIGGWVPSEKWAEDGRIPEIYRGLNETRSGDPAERTSSNVRDSDGTLIISRGDLTGGSVLAQSLCEEIGKPVLHIDLSKTSEHAAVSLIIEWFATNKIRILNVAGPRASEDAVIYSLSNKLLGSVFVLSQLGRR